MFIEVHVLAQVFGVEDYQSLSRVGGYPDIQRERLTTQRPGSGDRGKPGRIEPEVTAFLSVYTETLHCRGVKEFNSKPDTTVDLLYLYSKIKADFTRKESFQFDVIPCGKNTIFYKEKICSQKCGFV